MTRTGKWGLALGIATGAALALTLTTRPGKRARSESAKKTTKADIKATSLANNDSEVHYV